MDDTKRRRGGDVERTCPNGHEVREGLGFCTVCGSPLPTGTWDLATVGPAAAPPNAPPGRAKARRWRLAVAGVAAVVVLAGGVLAWRQGADDTTANEREFVAAVRLAFEDTTYTLSDEDLLATGWANCEMARNGTLAEDIAKAEAEIASFPDLGIAPGVMAERMTLPLTYLCPQYADALDGANSTSTTTTPPTSTSNVEVPSTQATIEPGDSDGPLVLSGDGLGDVKLGDPFDETVKVLSDLFGPAELPDGATAGFMCEGTREAWWPDAGLGIESKNQADLTAIEVYLADSGAAEIETRSGLRLGTTLESYRDSYDGNMAHDAPEDEGVIDGLGDFHVYSGLDADVSGKYDPETRQIVVLNTGEWFCVMS